MKTKGCQSVVAITLLATTDTRCTDGFFHDLSVARRYPTTTGNTAPRFMVAKGFGTSASSSGNKMPDRKKVKKSDMKKTQQKILKKYGANIAQGTQQRVEQAMSELPPHLQMATQLYQQLQKYKARLANMSVLQLAQLAETEVDGARRAKDELDRLYREHNFQEHDLHNIFQQITWDASADAKTARAIAGDMPADIRQKVDKACRIVAYAAARDGHCLDIGCGFGVLVPFLLQCGLQSDQIHGIDLSPEMIKNAREQHPAVSFEAVDFLKDYTPDDNGRFESIIFLSALHDFSNMEAALQKAASLLKPQGKLVIAHPQGASHVTRQSNANPVLVRRGLPTAEELRNMDLSRMMLEAEPAGPNTPNEATDGYLAVLTKQ
jgi:2-polyprenyl-3-methyl-5-hydroxy-6-metoxy-1,4-benzoquinol methylase